MGTTKASRANKPAQATGQDLPPATLVVDNGAHTIKAGFAQQDASTDSQPAYLAIPNALSRTRDKRVYVGTELNTHIFDWNEATFRRPVEKGYIVNWEAQREIWEHTFFDPKTANQTEVKCCNPRDTTLILSEAPNAMAALQKNTDEIIMEEWGFGGYARCIGPSLTAWNEIHNFFGDPASSQDPTGSAVPPQCLLVIDSGYSHTIVTPVYNGRPLQRAIRRLEIGGKYLTNYLKDLISIRQYNMLDETYIINQVKETACYVSSDFSGDLERAWKGNKKGGRVDSSGNGVVVDYVLPDPNTGKKGFIRPHESLQSAKQKQGGLTGATAADAEDVLVLGNERFTVPELLFTPQDVGMQRPGIPEIVMQSLSVLPTGLHPAFLANVLVVGGNALIPGMVDRLERDLRQLASAECVVRVRRPEDPVGAVWMGGTRLAGNREALKDTAITAHQYQEYGSAWAARKFAGD